MNGVTATDQLSLVFAALADPTRRAILAELTVGDATVTQLTAPLPISMPAVSRHLKVLEGAGLISRSREGKWQPSHLEAVPLREAAVESQLEVTAKAYGEEHPEYAQALHNRGVILHSFAWRHERTVPAAATDRSGGGGLPSRSGHRYAAKGGAGHGRAGGGR